MRDVFQTMPRHKGIGRAAKRRRVPLGSVSENVAAPLENESEEEDEPEPEPERPEDWLSVLLLEVVNDAVDLQRVRNNRFLKSRRRILHIFCSFRPPYCSAGTVAYPCGVGAVRG